MPNARQQAKAEVCIVIPFFNEALRFQAEEILKLVEPQHWRLVLVNDGSTDDTREAIDLLASRANSISVLHLEHNVGKGEAVRRGLLEAVKLAKIVGYCDADFATPTHEIIRLVTTLQNSNASMVLATRVALLGTEIERSAHRHYLGRVFATLSALTLGMKVYDTQCGAKAMRVSKTLEGALQDPFLSRWVFDVELLSRLRDAGFASNQFIEMPLQKWSDVRGSKLNLQGMARSVFDLCSIAVRRQKASLK
jgi:dolichyl-phosphate beta-glucosyltransferase